MPNLLIQLDSEEVFDNVNSSDFVFIKKGDRFDAQMHGDQSDNSETAIINADGDIGEELAAELIRELENEDGGWMGTMKRSMSATG
jgi:hypothetical protein